MNLTVEDFKRGVLAMDGEELMTSSRGRSFTLRYSDSGPVYVPDSSARSRSDSWDRVGMVLSRLRETGSSRPGDYRELTQHASYLLAVAERLHGGRPAPTPTVWSAEKPALARPHQRVGARSNAHVGRDFEALARAYFESLGVILEPDFPVEVGHATKKVRRFDLGSTTPPVLVECKSHCWTAGGKVPSAKITVWNEAMYYFHLAPPEYRKCFFVKNDRCERRGETLLDYYLRTYAHLVPPDVEFFEWDEASGALAGAEPRVVP